MVTIRDFMPISNETPKAWTAAVVVTSGGFWLGYNQHCNLR